MEKPSDYWRALDSLDPESQYDTRIQGIFAGANFDYLTQRTMQARRTQEPTLPLDVTVAINLARFASGRFNLVLEMEFSDRVYWVARIPHSPLDDDSRIALLSEIATMKFILKHTSIPIAQIYEFEATSDQPFGYPYIFMACLPGRTVDGVAMSIPRKHHPKVARQLANVLSELQKLTFSRIGRIWGGETAVEPPEIIAMAWHPSPGPLDTSLEYSYDMIFDVTREALSKHPNNAEWSTACWILKTAVAHIIVEDRVRGPFPLCHLDFHYGNMLFDKDYNLTGVIDWSNAQAAPLEQLAVSPEFLTFPALSQERNQPIVDFKALVVQHLRELEADWAGAAPSSCQNTDAHHLQKLTRLSTYMASNASLLAPRLYMASAVGVGVLFAGQEVAKHIYGDHITWEQLKKVYGHMHRQ